MKPILNNALSAARQASKIILHKFDRLDTIKISEKGHNDFVTEVDQAAERVIIETLKDIYPEHSFLGEESGQSDGDPDALWIIDPLDGTTNFIHGIPHFCISIAFQEKGKVQHGLIYDPIRQELFTASRGEGARLDDRRLRVSNCSTLDQALIGTGFPAKQTHQINHYLKTFEAIFPKTRGIRRGGSAALDLAYVAAGRLDGFWELSLKPWDVAAGVLMIQEAGGLVGDVLGQTDYLQHGSIVAGNSKIFKGIVKTLNPIVKEG